LTRIECGEGFTELTLTPEEIIGQAGERGLEVEFELGEKHAGRFTDEGTEELIETGKRWLQAGAVRLVVEARESAQDVGLFSAPGEFDSRQADHLAEAFGLEQLLFEAPNKASQFALIDHFGPAVQLGNVRLEEVLRVEIYLRGLQPYGFDMQNSPSEMHDLRDNSQPIILLSTSGTRLMAEAADRGVCHAACLRNASAQGRHLAEAGDDVVILGADSRGEFRDEDRLCAARIARVLVDAGYGVADRFTSEVLDR